MCRIAAGARAPLPSPATGPPGPWRLLRASNAMRALACLACCMDRAPHCITQAWRRASQDLHDPGRDDGRRAARYRCRPRAHLAAAMGAANLLVVGALNIFLVEAPALSFTVCCSATAWRVCCARGRLLAMGVARMMPWPRLVRGALRHVAWEERGGREVARSTCRSWNRLYIVECEYLVLCELAV